MIRLLEFARMTEIDRQAMYNVVVDKIGSVSYTLDYESLDTLSADDLSNISAQLLIAAHYLSRISVERTN
jgi:hypothetical protein